MFFTAGLSRISGKLPRFAGELQVRLFDVVGVQMQIAKRVDKGSRFEATNLRNHHRQQSIGCDIERHAQE